MKCMSIFILFIFSLGQSQNKNSIDSINKIPFQDRLKNASILEATFLKNAAAAIKINYKLGEAESYSNVSLVNYYQGKYDKDLYYSLKAISIFERHNYTEKLAFEYGELGYRLKNRNLKKAQIFMQKALKISEQNQFSKPLLSIYNNYGVIKEMQMELDSALYFYIKGLHLKQRVNDSVGIPYSLNNIAGVFVLRKQFAKALKLYAKSLQIRKKIKDNVGIAENLSYFGDCYLGQKAYLKAIEYYQKSIAEALLLNYVDLVQNGYKKIAECYELLGNSALAYANYKKYTQYKNLLLNKQTNEKIAELDIKYETNKKEKQLLEKDLEAKKRKVIILVLALSIFFIALLGYLIYRQQKLKNKQQTQEYELKQAILKIENQNKLQEQRLSISRDLHDNIGSQLTFIISSVDNVKYGFDIQNDKLNSKLTNISSFAKDTIVELRDTIWAMNSNEISYQDLENRIHNFIEKAKEVKDEIRFSFAVDNSLKLEKLSSVQGMNIYRTLQEAINNSIKYAKASIISVSIKKEPKHTSIVVKDNGIGFDAQTIEQGNGLKNMQKRIEEIGGTFKIKSDSDGTKIEITV